MAWGFAGQMIYIIKDLDLVVVMTTNTRDFTEDTFDGVSIIQNNVIPAAHRVHPRSTRALPAHRDDVTRGAAASLLRIRPQRVVGVGA